ncbi:hypothetical protein XBKQ1_320027 [Xenorhabdus bovienii str. kraussei Quebec]|uniref:Phage capsid-like C-terminal domain-containing protein n=1 Tax=Xenorhabdus bovienii str. kraussei Quebec TaxID=1398203 RepID=A0A077PA31_XENBV|nr:hypothetical protein XBKQ1_320027 [Xenorhabdus bovienii str. kraussei Quebec]
MSDEERSQVGKTQPTSKNLSNDELRHYILTGETRTLSTGVPSEGGYTVIPELNKQIMQQLADESAMRQICTIKTTRSNEYKQLVSVGGAAVTHGEEGKARCETTTPKMEEVSIKLFPIYAYPRTTQEIIDFSDVDVLGWLTSEIADTFVDTEETDLVSGDGSKKAKGFLSYLPWQIVRHRKRIRAISAIRKGVFLMRKYKALKELNNGVYRPIRSSGRSTLVENQI